MTSNCRRKACNTFLESIFIGELNGEVRLPIAAFSRELAHLIPHPKALHTKISICGRRALIFCMEGAFWPP